MINKKLVSAPVKTLFILFKSAIFALAQGKALAINYTDAQRLAREIKESEDVNAAGLKADCQDLLALQISALSVLLEGDDETGCLWETQAFLRSFLNDSSLYSPISYPQTTEEMAHTITAPDETDDVTLDQLKAAMDSFPKMSEKGIASFLDTLQRYHLLATIECDLVSEMDDLSSLFNGASVSEQEPVQAPIAKNVSRRDRHRKNTHLTERQKNGDRIEHYKNQGKTADSSREGRHHGTVLKQKEARLTLANSIRNGLEEF